MNNTVRVQCRRCNWRSHRAWFLCDCDYACSCGFGKCPKCGATVATPERIRAERAHDREYAQALRVQKAGTP